MIWETWYDFCPGDELWAVCQVQIQSVILSSGFPYQLFKAMVSYQVVEVMVKAWVRGSGLESWRCCLPVPSWEVKIPAYEEMSFGKLGSSLKCLSKFSQTGFISNNGPVVGTQVERASSLQLHSDPEQLTVFKFQFRGSRTAVRGVAHSNKDTSPLATAVFPVHIIQTWQNFGVGDRGIEPGLCA